MKKLTACATVSLILIAGLLAGLNYFTQASASPEWLYTLKWLNLILVICLLPAAAILIIAGVRLLMTSRHKRLVVALCLFCCCLSFALPLLVPDARFLDWRWQYLLSGCWLCGFLLAGLLLFIAAVRTGAVISSLLCLLGSLCLGLAVMEGALLFSGQPLDGLTEASAKSSHAKTGPGVPEYENWTNTACGGWPAPARGALPSFHRHVAFENDIFDVQYTFNDRGRRRLPQARPGAENDLLLFGCSFTFGFGLEDEQTWAWQLAQALGPDWQLENYGANGYSANHMLCMLEHGLISPPEGKNRYALFLALDQHLRRNEFFPNTPHYQLNTAGEAEAGGKAGCNWIYLLPRTFNGSQLARDASAFITSLIMRWPEKALSLYLAMLKKSATILAEKYDTRLIVLLWPGIEEIGRELKKMGIGVISARAMLHQWDTPEDPGFKYRIHRYLDPHPNQLAATELAQGLAHYFQNLENGPVSEWPGLGENRSRQ